MINKKSKSIVMLEFKRTSDTAETYYSDMKINSGEAACTHLRGSERPGRGARMGGGSFTSSRLTAFGQGKRGARGHEDVWDKRRGREKNNLQAR